MRDFTMLGAYRSDHVLTRNRAGSDKAHRISVSSHIFILDRSKQYGTIQNICQAVLRSENWVTSRAQASIILWPNRVKSNATGRLSSPVVVPISVDDTNLD